MAAQKGQPSEEFGQIWQILLIHVQTLVSQAWRGLFEKFKNPESTDGSDPAMGKESRSKCIPGRWAMSNQTVWRATGFGQLYSKKTISLAWSDVFEQFKNPESTVWCALALEQGFRSLALPGGQTMAIQRSKDWGFRIFSGGYLFGVFILACCQHNILISHYPTH